MSNPSLNEANTLQARIDDINEKLLSLKPEPVDERLVALHQRLHKEYKSLQKEVSKLSAKLTHANNLLNYDHRDKETARQQVEQTLLVEKSALLALLDVALRNSQSACGQISCHNTKLIGSY
jgi:chromosome segregation ATPase